MLLWSPISWNLWALINVRYLSKQSHSVLRRTSRTDRGIDRQYSIDIPTVKCLFIAYIPYATQQYSKKDHSHNSVAYNSDRVPSLIGSFVNVISGQVLVSLDYVMPGYFVVNVLAWVIAHGEVGAVVFTSATQRESNFLLVHDVRDASWPLAARLKGRHQHNFIPRDVLRQEYALIVDDLPRIARSSESFFAYLCTPAASKGERADDNELIKAGLGADQLFIPHI